MGYQILDLYCRLSQFVGTCECHVKNSIAFLEPLDSLKIAPTNLMVSSDMVSLFARVTSKDTLELLKPLFVPEIGDLLQFVLTNSYFYMEVSIMSN